MEWIDIVNEKNELTGKQEEKEMAHDKWLIHREVAVWIFNDKKELLIQKRAKSKRYFPDCWAIVAGHVQAGEDTDQAILREIQEEIGITVEKEDLEILLDPYLVEEGENRYFSYDYVYQTDKQIEEYQIQIEELSEVRYISLEEFEKLIQTKEGQVFATSPNLSNVLIKLKERMRC